MRLAALVLLAGLLTGSPAQAQDAIASGLEGTLRSCERWILDPAVKAGGPDGFPARVGMQGQMKRVQTLPEVLLPPAQFRAANVYWHIAVAQNLGFYMVVSEQIPMCHITGGGVSDLQPSIEAVLASPGFTERWNRYETKDEGGYFTTQFTNRGEPRLMMVVSRAKAPKGPTNGVQMFVTALMQNGN